MAKATKTDLESRIREVVQLILHGAEQADIVQYAAEKGWNVRSRQLRTYVERAYAEIAPILARDREQVLARHLMQRRALFARCMKINDYKTALQVLKDEAELMGLYAPKKVAPTTPDGSQSYDPVAGLADCLPELQAAVDRLRQEAGSTAGGSPAPTDPNGPPASGPGLALYPGEHDA
jgi:hypothetical protein